MLENQTNLSSKRRTENLYKFRFTSEALENISEITRRYTKALEHATGMKIRNIDIEENDTPGRGYRGDFFTFLTRNDREEGIDWQIWAFTAKSNTVDRALVAKQERNLRRLLPIISSQWEQIDLIKGN